MSGHLAQLAREGFIVQERRGKWVLLSVSHTGIFEELRGLLFAPTLRLGDGQESR